MLGSGDLVLSYMAMTHVHGVPSPDVSPPWEVSSADFEQRCAAAAAGGFAGIGINPAVYDSERAAGHSDTDLVSMLTAHGVVVEEIEAGAIVGPSALPMQSDRLDHVLRIAEVFGVTRLFFQSAPGLSRDELAQGFAWVCDRCAPHGIRVGVEFMDLPWLSSIPDADSALDVVVAAGRDNGGVVVDSYHHVNGANDWAQLEQLPGDRVVGVQLSDCAIPRTRDYIDDTLHVRLPPGEGDADLVRFVRTMDAIGVTCASSLEVVNDDVFALAPADLGRRLGAAARSTLGSARSAE